MYIKKHNTLSSGKTELVGTVVVGNKISLSVFPVIPA